VQRWKKRKKELLPFPPSLVRTNGPRSQHGPGRKTISVTVGPGKRRKKICPRKEPSSLGEAQYLVPLVGQKKATPLAFPTRKPARGVLGHYERTHRHESTTLSPARGKGRLPSSRLNFFRQGERAGDSEHHRISHGGTQALLRGASSRQRPIWGGREPYPAEASRMGLKRGTTAHYQVSSDDGGGH